MASQDRELHIECNSVSSSTLPTPPKGSGSNGVLRQCYSSGLFEYSERDKILPKASVSLENLAFVDIPGGSSQGKTLT